MLLVAQGNLRQDDFPTLGGGQQGGPPDAAAYGRHYDEDERHHMQSSGDGLMHTTCCGGSASQWHDCCNWQLPRGVGQAYLLSMQNKEMNPFRPDFCDQNGASTCTTTSTFHLMQVCHLCAAFNTASVLCATSRSSFRYWTTCGLNLPATLWCGITGHGCQNTRLVIPFMLLLSIVDE